MFLAIDIGNSTVGLGLFEGEQFVSRRMPTDPSRPAESLVKVLDDICGGKPLKDVIISSVVPSVSQTFKAAVRRLSTVEPLSVGPDCTGGLVLDVEEPEKLGPDRIAAAVGAAVLLGEPVMVVDFGTATTVNVVGADGPRGVYRGGAILPGINMMFRALSEHTARLPMVGPSGDVGAVGRTTEENIRAGVVLGTAGAVERLIREVKASESHEIKIAVTGGMMEYVGEYLSHIDLAEPDLVLKGLRAIYEHERNV